MDSHMFHNTNTPTHTHHQQDQDNDEILKTRISTHPLYDLLVQAHLDCLKVGEISNMESEQKVDRKQALNKENLGMFSESELDLFMEAYCLALEKLKDAMEEPQQKSMAFINNMHSQLKELTRTSLPHQPSSPTSSAHCKFQSDSSI